MSSTYAPLPTNEQLSAPPPTSHTDPARPSSPSSKFRGDSYDPPARTGGNSTRHAIFRALVTTVVCWVVGFVVGGVAVVVFAPDVAGRALEGLSSCAGRAGRRQLWKRQGGAGYSTTTYSGGQGATSTFVKTTRPIVNPGGYTIGTLTGFVPVSTTTLPSSPSASSSPPSTAAASSANETTASVTSPTLTTDTTTEPTQTPGEPSFTRSNPFVLHPESSSAPSSDSIDSVRRLFKRQSPSSSILTSVLKPSPNYPTSLPTAPSTGGKEEYSTSIDTRQGRETTVTLVKTTRPIVNAGGYTIGTLDGAWVDVAKQTDRPPPSSSPSSAPSHAPEKQGHDELRKRNLVRLAEAE
ncbi:pathogenesis-related protein 1-like protein [Rhodotorula toruloides]|uniref:Pathogenesis-related protein 1-like protein n=1 Tax=Rhodotorula toruloides TaxID=5286 RepID=A0A511KQG3_RHOTO|nr:pathogenesis-related protein 1-like protein [Rhodotorula toruloides]